MRASVHVGGDAFEQVVFGQGALGAFGEERRPVHAQRVSFHDEGVGGQRQKLDVPAQDPFRLGDHLAFGYPQRGFRHRHGEVVDFDAVELADMHLDEAVRAPLRPR